MPGAATPAGDHQLGSKQWILDRIGNDPARGPHLREQINASDDPCDVILGDSSGALDTAHVDTLPRAEVQKGLEVAAYCQAKMVAEDPEPHGALDDNPQRAVDTIGTEMDDICAHSQYYKTLTAVLGIVGYPQSEAIDCGNGHIAHGV